MAPLNRLIALVQTGDLDAARALLTHAARAQHVEALEHATTLLLTHHHPLHDLLHAWSHVPSPLHAAQLLETASPEQVAALEGTELATYSGWGHTAPYVRARRLSPHLGHLVVLELPNRTPTHCAVLPTDTLKVSTVLVNNAWEEQRLTLTHTRHTQRLILYEEIVFGGPYPGADPYIYPNADMPELLNDLMQDLVDAVHAIRSDPDPK